MASELLLQRLAAGEQRGDTQEKKNTSGCGATASSYQAGSLGNGVPVFGPLCLLHLQIDPQFAGQLASIHPGPKPEVPLGFPNSRFDENTLRMEGDGPQNVRVLFL